MLKKHNNHVIQFLKKHTNQDVVDLWCEKENQEQFRKIRFIHENEKKRPMSSFFLYCKERRPLLLEEKPYYPATRIISLLAKEWQDHKAQNDDIYKKFKDLAQENFFYYIHYDDITNKYPHFTPDDVKKLLDLMYEKYKNSEQD
ncbi:MAG: HMG-box domain-containing protein [Enterobacter sp.]